MRPDHGENEIRGIEIDRLVRAEGIFTVERGAIDLVQRKLPLSGGETVRREIADMELEKIALNDQYFIDRKLYPNVDFYSGITLRALGFPADMFTVLFALARTVGWIAQWKEMIEDPSQKIGRPRQIYTGAGARDFVPINKR